MRNPIPVLLVLVLVGAPLAAAAQEQAEAHWLAERAATADVVVLAQLDRIDYEYERDFPVGGEAWFKPLISYKSADPLTGVLVVSEQGLKDNECYFPRMAPWEERPRYLLFLNRDEDQGTLRGHPDGCAIEILVGAEGRYAARWPQPAFGGEHGRGDAAIRARVQPMTFQGPGARIDAADMLAHQRRNRAERDAMKLEGTELIPTRGIPISELRALMRPGLIADEDEEQPSERLEALREQMLERARESAADGQG
jgi:hypothetical protein